MNIPQPSDEDSIFGPMTAIGDELRDIVSRLRDIQGAKPDAIAYYGGRGFPRYMSIAITNIEQALLWLGEHIEDPD